MQALKNGFLTLHLLGNKGGTRHALSRASHAHVAAIFAVSQWMQRTACQVPDNEQDGEAQFIHNTARILLWNERIATSIPLMTHSKIVLE